MKINNLESDYDDETFYSEEFKIDVESNLDYIVERSYVVTFEPAIGVKYKGDFYGLLDHLKIKKNLHQVCLLINSLRCTGDYDGESQSISLPREGILDSLRDTFTARIEIF